jgi:hypothetical protein
VVYCRIGPALVGLALLACAAAPCGY